MHRMQEKRINDTIHNLTFPNELISAIENNKTVYSFLLALSRQISLRKFRLVPVKR